MGSPLAGSLSDVERQLLERNQELWERNQLVQKAKGAIEQLQIDLEEERRRRKEAEANSAGTEQAAISLGDQLEQQLEQRATTIVQLRRELALCRDAELTFRSESAEQQRRSAESEEHVRAELSGLEQDNASLRLQALKAEAAFAQEVDTRQDAERNAGLKQQQLDMLQRCSSFAKVHLTHAALPHSITSHHFELSSNALHSCPDSSTQPRPNHSILSSLAWLGRTVVGMYGSWDILQVRMEWIGSSTLMTS